MILKGYYLLESLTITTRKTARLGVLQMEFWAIAYRYQEDIFYDFEKEDFTHQFSAACLLPSEDIANQIVEDQLGHESVAAKVTLHSLTEQGVMSYSVSEVKEWL